MQHHIPEEQSLATLLPEPQNLHHYNILKHSTYESYSVSKFPEDIEINLEVITALNVHWNITFEM